MKRKPLIFALALLLVVGAALWGVNYRLDHPPLTKADKEFRALVAGADRMELWRSHSSSKSTLDSTELNELVRQYRLSQRVTFPGIAPPSFGKSLLGHSSLLFWQQDKPIIWAFIYHTSKGSIIHVLNPHEGFYQVNPRFNKRLNRALDAYLPQRVRP